MFAKLFQPIHPCHDFFNLTRTQLLARAALGTLVLVGAGCAVRQDAGTHPLSLTSSLFLLSELAYDLDMDDTSANKQLLNQQSKEGAAVPSSDPGSAAPRPSPAAAVTLVLLLLLLGHRP